MKLKKYIMPAIALLSAAFITTGCSNDDDNDGVAKAVLASAKTLTFEGIGDDPQSITVYSDATWTVDAPDWVNVSPKSGSGTTVVVISVPDNLRDGTLNNPRKAEVVFRGHTLASRAIVNVVQLGDNYRDCQTYEVDDIYAVPNESYFEVKDAIVVSKTQTSYMIAEAQATDYMYITCSETLAVGDKVSFRCQKLNDSKKLAYLAAENVTVTSSGNSVTRTAEATDITGQIDTYKSDKRDYVAIEGVLSGTNISVNGAQFQVSIPEYDEAFDIDALNGHVVKAYGYYSGTASPYIYLNVQSADDLGEAIMTYWSEDFEWLAPWAQLGNGSPCGDSVGKNDESGNSPQIVTPVIDGVSALAACEARGYEFLRVCDPSKNIGECIYLNSNYLKFGKTSYQAGIILPKIESIPDNAKNLFFEFSWCPMRQGSGKIDPVNLIVIVTNGSDEETISIPTHGWENNHKLEWIKAKVDLSKSKVTKDTRITIRQTEWPAATANRWFLDNLRIYSNL